MNFVVNVHEAFWEDVKDARIYYEFISVNIADSFDLSLDFALKKLENNPNAYFNKSKKYRLIRLQKFPYQIVYTVNQNTILIWCLHHDKTSKQSWRQRSKE